MTSIQTTCAKLPEYVTGNVAVRTSSVEHVVS